MATSKKKAPPAEAIGTIEKQDNSITTKDGRARNFACVLYPESAPCNWLDIIAEAKIPVLVSPLHKDDINPTGEKKKSHHHIISLYENKKTIEQASEFFASFGGVGCEVVKDIRSYSRYLCHLDNPEKAQYKPDDVKQFGGADYLSIIELPTDRLAVLRQMQSWVRTNEVVSYAALMDYAADNEPTWFKVLCESASYVMDKYLKSLKWEIDQDFINYQANKIRQLQEELGKLDPETGEILEPEDAPGKQGKTCPPAGKADRKEKKCKSTSID